MSSLQSLPDPPQPLPRVPGPKLQPFTPTAHADIEFIQHIGDPENITDAYVWRVRINGAEPLYALKMFRFKSSTFLRETIGGYTTRRLASPQREVDYFDPFNCECRVYGRLKQENREDLAVRAHGYLLLTTEQEVAFTARRTKMWAKDYVPDYADGEKLNGIKYWNRQEENRHLPIRAIVKELCEGPGFTDFFRPPQLSDMWNDLEDLHKLGILVRDVTPDNYVAGKFLDFSQSWTVPTPYLEAIAPGYLDDERQADPLGLQSMILDLGLSNSWKWSEVIIPKELQDCASGEGKGKLDRFGANPTAYDWRKWEEDLGAVDVFMEQELYAEQVSESEQGENEG